MSGDGGDGGGGGVDARTPVQFLPKVGPRRGKLIAKLGPKVAGDLLYFFPRDYENPALETPVDQLSEGITASMVGVVTDAEIRSLYRGKSKFGALLENESGIVRIQFFNQEFRSKQIVIGDRLMISGSPKLDGLRWQFTHPTVTKLGVDEVVPRPRPLAIYPMTEGLRQPDMRIATDAATAALAESLPEALAGSVRAQAAAAIRESGVSIDGPLPPIGTAIRDVHHPVDMTSLRAARLRLVFQELFVMQLALAMRRRQLTTLLAAPPIETTSASTRQIIDRFGFALTADQRAAIESIRVDIARQYPMNRMVQGDVGSGKTVVAAFAMLAAAGAGYQSVMMAPTEVLARQHHATLTKILRDTPYRLGLLCGSMSAGERRDVERGIDSGDIDLLVGTQALIHGDRRFHRLGLCVVDEQHKFGVGQRVTLRGGDDDDPESTKIDPHYLVMSATPIPRSISLTLFGDTDVSVIRDKPPGRGVVKTYLARDDWRDRWWAFVRERLDEGRQAFVVAPRVADTDAVIDIDIHADEIGDRGEGIADRAVDIGTDSDERPASAPENAETTSSVESLMRELSGGPLAGYRMELLHGRMDNDHKAATMQMFARGDIDVLVTTTVIEVGIDVPNATVMTITGAQRFGLAQLHQLRGRIGRGGHDGHVAVFTDGPQPPEENERLAVFESTDDGFELAEADFRLRGPGDLLGRRQSGMPEMRIADLIKDADVIVAARELARQIIDENPDLEGEDFELLRRQVLAKYRQRLTLGDAV